MLRRLRQGLWAVAVFSLVLALCPCLVCSEMAADDCCASEGVTISSMCCADDAGSRTVAPTVAFTAFAPAALAHPMAIDAAPAAPVLKPQIPNRPIVARAVLRI